MAGQTEDRDSFIHFEDRLSDSPLVERVWRCHSERAGKLHSVAASHFEMAVTRYRGKTSLTLRGPETKASTLDCPGEGEWARHVLISRLWQSLAVNLFPDASG